DRLDQTRSIGTMILFDKQSAELTPEAQLQLDELATELRGKPHKVEVRGHAIRLRRDDDEETLRTWALCYARSLNTMKFLVSCGIEPHRFRLSQDGEFEPYSDQGNPIADPRNARVEVSALGELTREYKASVKRRAGDFVPAESVPNPAHTDQKPDEA